jgi:hypothetical protein
VYSNQIPANTRQELRVNKFIIAESASAGNILLSLTNLLKRKSPEKKAKLLHSPKDFVRFLEKFIGVKEADIKK